MRVLFVTSMHPSPGDPQRGILVQRLADAMAQRGHVIEWTHLGHHGGPARYIRARTRVLAAIGALQPDVVHVHFGYSGLAVPRVPVPLVTSFYGDDLNGTWAAGGGTTWKSKLGIVLSQAVSLRSAQCIAASEPLRQRLWFASARRKTTVIRDAVDPDLFQPRPRDVARDRLGLSQADVLVLFPHDLRQATKRPWLAQAAVDQLQSSVPGARLWVVNGKPPSEMPWYYAAADVMVITSALESGPSTAKEALSCGLPVVGVPVGDVALFDDVPDATFLAPADAGALSDALRRALVVGGAPRCSRLPVHLTLAHAAARIETVYHAASLAATSRAHVHSWRGNT